MPTIDTDNLIAWNHTDPTPDQLQQASNLADELSETAFMEETKTAREKALLIVGLLWPATD